MKMMSDGKERSNIIKYLKKFENPQKNQLPSGKSYAIISMFDL